MSERFLSFWTAIENLLFSVNILFVLKDSVNVRKIFLILNSNRKSPYVFVVCLRLRILINVRRT